MQVRQPDVDLITWYLPLTHLLARASTLLTV